MRSPFRPVVFLLAAGTLGAASTAPPSVPERIREARKTVEEIRGRTFRKDVPSESVGPARLRELLSQKLVEGLVIAPEDYFRSLAAIGAIDARDLPDLRGKLLDFYGGQVLAFYDPDEGKFFVSESGREKLGNYGGMEENLVFTHELTHALQDQYLSLDQRLQALRSDGDAGLALEALLEGEATEVMIESAVKDLPVGSESIESMLAPFLTSSLADLDPDAAKVPAFFAEQLFFPYSEGTAYVRAKKKSGGWKAIDALWNAPPATTAAILHPDRPAAAPEPPLLSDTAVAPPPGAALLYADTLGEWTLRFLFRHAGVSEPDATAAAWRADRFLFFKNGDRVSWAGRIRAADDASAASLLAAWKKVNPASGGSVRGSDVSVWSGFEKSPF